MILWKTLNPFQHHALFHYIVINTFLAFFRVQINSQLVHRFLVFRYQVLLLLQPLELLQHLNKYFHKYLYFGLFTVWLNYFFFFLISASLVLQIFLETLKTKVKFWIWIYFYRMKSTKYRGASKNSWNLSPSSSSKTFFVILSNHEKSSDVANLERI